MQDKLKIIAEHYGIENQSIQLMEEMAELTIALNKYRRSSKNEHQTISESIDEQFIVAQIMEEICDVEIVLEQIKYLLNHSSNDIEIWKQRKIERQLERIAKE
jgi:hypothetical protein